ncbi:MAG TPA: ATP-binding cassette domain-containing protein [Baekduia sp.]|nr:ATP-binding cassette domain-containing protein [Baekduia sp.]
MTSLIAGRGLTAGYSHGAAAIRGIDIEVRPGEVVALLGPNGAGKTTTLLALTGQLPISDGDVTWLGESARTPLHKRARQGLAYVSEERSVFQRLTTRQNLALARGGDLDRALAIFPELGELFVRRGGQLSGGEQQMLTLARALSRPTHLLIADELSLGLAPRTVGRLLDAVRRAADDGMGALLVEQHVHRVLEISDRVYLLRQGVVQYAGTADDARGRIDEIRGMYLSGAAASTRSDEAARSDTSTW